MHIFIYLFSLFLIQHFCAIPENFNKNECIDERILLLLFDILLQIKSNNVILLFYFHTALFKKKILVQHVYAIPQNGNTNEYMHNRILLLFDILLQIKSNNVILQTKKIFETITILFPYCFIILFF